MDLNELTDTEKCRSGIHFAHCLLVLNKISECIQHLQEMSAKFKDNVECKQKILLNIAILSFKEKNFEEASTNFLEAIEVDTENQLLQV